MNTETHVASTPPPPDERPNISDEVAVICHKLGLDPSSVARLDIGMSAVDVTVVLRHPDTGNPYIPPGGTERAREVRHLPARIIGGRLL